MIESFSSLWTYLQVILGYISPPIVAAFVVGLFYRRANANGAFYSFLLGYGLVIIFVILKVTDIAPQLTNIHFLHQVPALFVICVILNLIISNMFAAPAAEKIEGLTWSIDIYNQETKELEGLPWYKNYRILAVILLLLTALVVGWYW